MDSYRLSARAASQLRGIYVESIHLFGPNQADEYRRGLDDCFSMLARHPRLGRISETIRPGLRRHEYGSHVILYKEMIGHVLIVAVVHARSIHGLKL